MQEQQPWVQLIFNDLTIFCKIVVSNEYFSSSFPRLESVRETINKFAKLFNLVSMNRIFFLKFSSFLEITWLLYLFYRFYDGGICDLVPFGTCDPITRSAFWGFTIEVHLLLRN